ncbi:MAG TPA: acyl-CoA/acyl-ACP dehydrogenase [Dehalococcoidia bacterium]|nr:acyl-CoA/acyl-ACP dehydrogenase [Dehalococcoidia bacterium]
MTTIPDIRRKYLGAPGCSDEDLEIVKLVRDFVDKEIMPCRRDLDGGWHHDEKLAMETIRRVHQGLVDIGYQRMSWPEEVGGLPVNPGIGAMVAEEIARGDCGLATPLGIVSWTMSAFILARRMDLAIPLLRKVCDDKPHASCMAITEAGGGANVEDPTQHGRPIRTIARLDGNEWVINGHKIWPSSASVSDLTYLTVCTTDPDSGDEGIALIHVPPESKGLSFSQPLEKMGMCWTDINAEIFYDDVRVPKENRLLGPGEDAKLLHDIVGIGRLGTCSYAVGVAQACFDIVVDYTMNREIAGRPVRSRSLHAAIIGEMAMKIDCARAFYQRVSDMQRTGQFGRPGEPVMLSKSSAAQNNACEMAIWVVNKAMELMGSYGYSYGYEIEKYYRDMKILQLWLGGPQRRSLDTALGYYSFEW